MFRDKYKRAMDSLEPSHEKIANIVKIASEGKRLPRKRFAGRKTWYRVGALAACAALIFALYKPVTDYLSGKAANDSAPREASSYAEIYRLLQRSYLNGDGKDLADYQDEKTNQTPTEAGNADDMTGRESGQSYSGTNLQVLGVDESDIVKTDGKYIYAVTDDDIFIISAQNGLLEPVSKVSRYVYQNDTLTSRAFELYIREGRLVVLKEIAVEPAQNSGTKDTANGETSPGYDPSAPVPTEPDVGIPEKDYYKYCINGQTAIGVELYDISDIRNPKALNTIGQSGYIISSRMVGDMLYLVTSYTVCGDIEKSQPETYIPKTYANGKDSLVAASDILYNPGTQSYAYMVISGIDTSGNGKMVSVKTVLGYGCTIYANAKNLYLASPDFVSETKDGYNIGYNLTNIVKISLDNGYVEFAANGSVPGNVLNQFAMDERNGVFRIVTTVYKYKYQATDNGVSYSDAVSYDSADLTNDPAASPSESAAKPNDRASDQDPDNGSWNALYTLDDKLNIIGKIEKLAAGETVYSVRFIGDTGYFVTFRQTDPLFSVDLSDPEHPVLLGELKIPGFSNYLHTYGDGLLFGLGMNADAASGRTDCMKLSMFDVSDPSAVTEKHTLVLDGFYYSAASYNHKAILIDPEKNLIGFQADAYYLIYSYDQTRGFTELSRLPLYNASKGYLFDMSNARGLYIGEYLYLINQYQAASFSLGTFSQIDALTFGN